MCQRCRIGVVEAIAWSQSALTELFLKGVLVEPLTLPKLMEVCQMGCSEHSKRIEKN